MNRNFWKDRRVFVTGHTGFKGAWLSAWLGQAGAQVFGFSLDPEASPNLWDGLGCQLAADVRGDVRDLGKLAEAMRAAGPDIVLHLAAQSLVRRSYREPVDTFETNVMGTVNVLESIRQVGGVQAAVIVTSDKCYSNSESGDAFRETDPMGGHDPYSASKGCAELVTHSMRESFFGTGARDGNGCRIASARAGNVIGGGDWSEDRLVPDIIRGCLSGDGRVVIRSPNAIRPWQHVLEPIRGYLMLAEALAAKVDGAEGGWNFGPPASDERAVIDVAEKIVGGLQQGTIDVSEAKADLHEAKLLALDSSKAEKIGWKPALSFDQTIDLTAAWYREWSSGRSMAEITSDQIRTYENIVGGLR